VWITVENHSFIQGNPEKQIQVNKALTVNFLYLPGAGSQEHQLPQFTKITLSKSLASDSAQSH